MHKCEHHAVFEKSSKNKHLEMIECAKCFEVLKEQISELKRIMSKGLEVQETEK